MIAGMWVLAAWNVLQCEMPRQSEELLLQLGHRSFAFWLSVSFVYAFELAV